jgi:hypothetical protein
MIDAFFRGFFSSNMSTRKNLDGRFPTFLDVFADVKAAWDVTGSLDATQKMTQCPSIFNCLVRNFFAKIDAYFVR